jgi:hypothetical protein
VKNFVEIIAPPDSDHAMKTDTEINRREATSEPEPFTPRTPLGKRLLAIRNHIIADGLPLLTQEEIEGEIAERRGGSNNGSL